MYIEITFTPPQALDGDPPIIINIALINKVFVVKAVISENTLNPTLLVEIEVNIEANSLLYSMERHERFKQDYLPTIKTKSSLYLDQYERVESYQNQEKFMIYYRLNKQTYRDAKLKRQNEAAEEAARFVSSAKALVD